MVLAIAVLSRDELLSGQAYLRGACLSGAGSTLLAFATGRFDAIGEAMRRELEARGVAGSVRVLEPDMHGLRMVDG